MDKSKKLPPNKKQCCGLNLGCYEFVEMQEKIKDLETKLAESERQIKDAREARDMAVDSWCKNRRKYEAQIAEMQNKSFILYSILYETLEKQGSEDIASQIDQMTGWTYDKEADWLKENRNYDQLKQQLAEKEKEIANIQHRLKVTEKALTKAVNDKCFAEDIIAESFVGKGAKVAVPKKEQWYLEQADKEV